MPIHTLGKGARKRPRLPGEVLVGKELAAVIPDFTKSTNLTEPPDEDQGSSESCTSQGYGYHFWQWTGLQTLRNDTYSHTFIPPDGGAYLTSPGEFVAQYGAVFRDNAYQDPNPETEPLMEKIVVTTTSKGRVKAFKLALTSIHVDINTIGNLLEQYKGIVIGVNGTNAGWQDMVDPTYSGPVEWEHALYVYDRAVRNGQAALKAKSSWCNEVKNHYISQDYFNNGGVFEALGLTVTELNMNQAKVVKSKTSPTVYICYPVPNMTYLNETSSLQGITVPSPIPDSDSL